MDTLTPDERRRNIRAIKSRNTKPELIVRRWLYEAGYRYRLNRKDLPGKPDISMKGRRIAIFINGCFWHQHSGCRYAVIPATRRAFWEAKLNSNKTRDGKIKQILIENGWRTLVIWECSLKSKENRERTQREILDWLKTPSPYTEISG